jgi:predicted lipoprotein with Yx(FWY)xxD motif
MRFGQKITTLRNLRKGRGGISFEFLLVATINATQFKQTQGGKMPKSFLVAIIATAAATAMAFGQIVQIKVGDTTKGKVLTNDRGATLYVFDKDSSGTSACNGSCATLWPPLLVAAGEMPTGDYGLVTRSDGSRQWAYKGRPLYTWKNDKEPGDITGDGFGGTWHVAQP